ncbi:hypothetical protein [Massilia sp.]|nr:hypothetical protein [Massilia sp.]
MQFHLDNIAASLDVQVAARAELTWLARGVSGGVPEDLPYFSRTKQKGL